MTQVILIQPIQAADLPEIASFWQANLNPNISQQAWINAFRHDWLPNPPNYGFMLIVDDRLVGALGAIYSRQSIQGIEMDFCNITSLIVESRYRSRSMDLISRCLSQKQFAFTNFTPTSSVRKMLQIFRFDELRSGEIVVLHTPVPPGAAGVKVISSPQDMGQLLDANAVKLWRDHHGLYGLNSFAIGRAAEWCLVFWRRSSIKGLPGARILGFNDVGLFIRWAREISGHLLLRHGIVGMRIEEHLLPEGLRFGIRRPSTVTRMYRGALVPNKQVSLLYSELVALPI